ncbi:hypothetical protein AB0395_34895 [Streptosporangium sp. NPDC051023]|uniref:hypothetical protein n=1 Tax=Streptosporangium sp. NPDC051023 TaxID=3155410 RepID=UPI00344D79BD
MTTDRAILSRTARTVGMRCDVAIADAVSYRYGEKSLTAYYDEDARFTWASYTNFAISYEGEVVESLADAARILAGMGADARADRERFESPIDWEELPPAAQDAYMATLAPIPDEDPMTAPNEAAVRAVMECEGKGERWTIELVYEPVKPVTEHCTAWRWVVSTERRAANGASLGGSIRGRFVEYAEAYRAYRAGRAGALRNGWREVKA